MTPDDPRIEAAVAAVDDKSMTHVWVIAEKRCICGATGSYDELERHLRVVKAQRVLAATDAVDPLRAALGEPETEYGAANRDEFEGDVYETDKRFATHVRSVWRSPWRPVDPE